MKRVRTLMNMHRIVPCPEEEEEDRGPNSDTDPELRDIWDSRNGDNQDEDRDPSHQQPLKKRLRLRLRRKINKGKQVIPQKKLSQAQEAVKKVKEKAKRRSRSGPAPAPNGNTSTTTTDTNGYICSIAPLKLRGLKGPLSALEDEDFQLHFGNYDKVIAHDGAKVDYPSHPEIVSKAWNVTFSKVFSARSEHFYVISSQMDVFLLKSALKSKEKGLGLTHIIFHGSEKLLLLKGTRDLKQCQIQSVAFVECDFGAELDARVVLEGWLLSGSVKAFSFVKCKVRFPREEHGGRSPPFIRASLRTLNVKRVEFETTCQDSNFSQDGGVIDLIQRTFLDAVSLGCRHSCVCSGSDCYFTPDLVPLLESRAQLWEELEFDMNIMTHFDLFSTFTALAESPNLTTMSLNLKRNTKEAEELHKSLFESLKAVRALEIKGSGYFDPSREMNILKVIAPFVSPLLTHLSIIDVGASGKRLNVKDSLRPFVLLESLLISNCEFDDMTAVTDTFISLKKRAKSGGVVYQPKKFTRAVTLPTFHTLIFKNLNTLSWNLVLDIATGFPWLVKLDLSGMNTFSVPNVNTEGFGSEIDCLTQASITQTRRTFIYHPLQHIFAHMTKLKELLLDDLEIGDRVFFGGLDEWTARKWVQEKNVKPWDTSVPTLASLRDLQFLSIQRTDVSNITLHCIAWHMPNVTSVNVSFTHVNNAGIQTSRVKNPKLQVVAEGCRISKWEESLFRTPVLPLPDVMKGLTLRLNNTQKKKM